jgi:hypothetical protein
MIGRFAMLPLTTFRGLTYDPFEEVEPPRVAPVGRLTGLQLDFARFCVLLPTVRAFLHR